MTVDYLNPDVEIACARPLCAVRCRLPDVAWVANARLARLSMEEKRRFLPLCPDFVIELCSPTDSVAEVQQKMAEYRANGARLGWLLDLDRRRVAVYCADGRVEWLERPISIAGDPVLPGFILSSAAIWEPAI